MSEQQEIAPPEPKLTGEELIARAAALRPLLREKQAECERIGHVPGDVNVKLIEAGFYRIVQPRRFGGYECDVPTFFRAMIELSRGCIETGWVVCLTSGHPLILASFPEQAQREAYGMHGEFRCPASFSPIGKAVAVDGGYRVTGGWDSASGIDGATHYIGSAQVEGGPMLQVLLKRDEFTIDDNWHVMGMHGTGSKRVVAKDLFIPSHRTLAAMGADRAAAPAKRAPRIYDNPLYGGRIQAFLIGEASAVAVGGALGALDAYEELLRTKTSHYPPFEPRYKSAEYQTHYGRVLALISTAEAALIRAGEDYMEYARDDAERGAPFDDAKEQRLVLIEQQAIRLCWEAMELIYRTAGTSASAKEGTLIGRAFRNLAVINTHPALQLDRFGINAARTRLGVALAAPSSAAH